MNIDIIIKELDKLMNKAIKKNEVPVACVIVKDNKILSKAYNITNKTNNILDHAEILAIKKASKILNNWRLSDCTMYISLEPCSMCKEIIKKSRINNVIYFSKQNNYKTEKNPNYKYIKNTTLSEKLTIFFKTIR